MEKKTIDVGNGLIFVLCKGCSERDMMEVFHLDPRHCRECDGDGSVAVPSLRGGFREVDCDACAGSGVTPGGDEPAETGESSSCSGMVNLDFQDGGPYEGVES